jgi:hypothetical protein
MLLFKAMGLLIPSMRRAPSMAQKIVNGTFDDRDHAVETLVRHNDEVRRRVPPDKLLVFEVKEGWGPMCDFLGVEEPDVPFPHLNDREELPKMMRRRMATALAPTIGKTIVAVTVLLATQWTVRAVSTRSEGPGAQPVRA